MQTLKQWKQQLDANGFVSGESAKAFRERDPQAAQRIAQFMKANMPQLVAELSAIVIEVKA